MSDTLYVTPAQVLAAKLALELSKEAGEAPDEALEAIANAREVAPQESGTNPGTSADELAPSEGIATLQRIERQLQRITPDVPRQERDQAGRQSWEETEEILRRRLANVEGGSPAPDQPLPSKGPDIGTRAELEVARRGGTMPKEEVERIIAEYEEKQRMRQREQPDRGDQGPDRDPDGSGGVLW
jgi:hypothetical protein